MTHFPKKTLTYLLLVAVFLAGVYYAYHEGYIPKIGQGNKGAQQLKQKIESLEGTNIEPVMAEFIAANAFVSPAEKQELINSFKKDVDVVFSYSDISSQADGNNGVVILEEPKITISSKEAITEIAISKLKISANPNEADKISYSIIGSLDVFSSYDNVKNKVFSIKSDVNNGSFLLASGHIIQQKINAKNISFVEGRGNTTIIKAAEVNSNISQENGVIKTTSEYKDVVLGDMLKLFVGNIEPVDLTMNYNYGADNIDASEISIKLPDAAIIADAKLRLKNDIPVGKVYIKLQNHKKIISLFSKYLGITPADNNSLHKFLMEVGADEGVDASFDLQFDENKKMRINGRSEEEFNMLLNKHFPKKAKGEI